MAVSGDRDYEDRSASDRSKAGYVVLAIVAAGIAGLVLYDLRKSGPADGSLQPQQAAPGGVATPQQPAAAPPAVTQP